MSVFSDKMKGLARDAAKTPGDALPVPRALALLDSGKKEVRDAGTFAGGARRVSGRRGRRVGL